MIDLFHWLASFIVLSVALAHLENIQIQHMRVQSWIVRAIGWSLIGIDAFGGVIAPLYGTACVSDKLGLIGFALCAVAYRWEGATKYEGVRRRANDR